MWMRIISVTGNGVNNYFVSFLNKLLSLNQSRSSDTNGLKTSAHHKRSVSAAVAAGR